MGIRKDWEKLLPEHGVVSAMDEKAMIVALVTVLDKHLTPPPNEDFIRASGDVLCEECGDTYRHHARDKKRPDYNEDYPLHVLCGGQRVKL